MGKAAAVAPVPPRLAIPNRAVLRHVRNLTRLEPYLDAARPIGTLRFAPARVLPPLVVLLTAQGAREMLVDQQDCFDKGVGFHIEFQRLLGRSSFSMADAEWAP